MDNFYVLEPHNSQRLLCANAGQLLLIDQNVIFVVWDAGEPMQCPPPEHDKVAASGIEVVLRAVCPHGASTSARMYRQVLYA